jgi:hypothetical protein
MKKLPHYYFSWIVFPINRDKCELLPLKTKQSGGKIFSHSNLQDGMFLEQTPRGRSYSEEYKQKQEKQKNYHSSKMGTWISIKVKDQGGYNGKIKKYRI